MKTTPRIFTHLFARAAALLLAACSLATPPGALAQVAGTLESGFNPSVTNSSSIGVAAMAVQADGKIVIGGNFQTVGGQPRSSIARLHADGSVESLATFAIGSGVDGLINGTALQEDGRIVIAGNFTTVNGQGRNRIARLNADGSVDASFNPGSGTNNNVYALAMQSDGKILIGGNFTTVAGVSRSRIARLNGDGSLDTGFNPGSGLASGQVSTIAVQPDGQILIGGNFSTVNGQPRGRIARLNPDGSLESTATFNPGTGVDNFIRCLVVQPDGKILVGGSFSTFSGQTRNHLARLHPNGTLESTATFANAGLGGLVRSLALQADGKIVVCGDVNVRRLHPNGTEESSATFNVGTGAGNVARVALQPDGRILVGGTFTTFNGTARNRLARLHNDAASRPITTPGDTSIVWTRSGSAPEVRSVTFETSTDGGVNWSAPQPATPFPGGWQRTGLSLAEGTLVRARGRTTGGEGNASSSVIEQVATSGPVLHFSKLDAVPGAGVVGSGVPAGATFTSFGLPAISDSGSMAFLGRWTSPSGTGAGIFAGNPAQLVVRIGDTLPGLAGATIKSLRDPLLDPAGNAAFGATITGAGITTANDFVLIGSAPGGTLDVLAREGAQPPGAPAGAQWKSFSALALSGANGPLFFGTMAKDIGGVTTADDTALWAVFDGAVRMLLREGQSLAGRTLRSINPLRAISGSPSTTRGHNHTGQIICLATFTDGTSAILTLEVR